MRKRNIVSLIIIFVILLIFIDFRINGIWVLEGYFKQMQTDSWWENNYSFDNTPRAYKDSTINIEIEEIDVFKLNNTFGNVTIKGEDRNDLRVDYKITVYAKNEAEAKKFIKKLDIKKDINEKELKLFLKEVEKPEYIKAIKVEYEIKAPKKLALVINNNYGQMLVSDFNSDLILSNKYDPLKIYNINGKVTARARYANLFMKNIEQDVVVETGYNKTSIDSVKGNLTLNSSYSMVEVENIKGRMKLEGKYGSIWIRDMGGDIELNTKYTGLNGAGIKGKIDAEMRYGELNLSEVKNDLNIKSEYCDLNVNLASELEDYQLDCSSRKGNIISNIELSVQSKDGIKELKGVVGKGTVNIKMHTEYGDIFIN